MAEAKDYVCHETESPSHTALLTTYTVPSFSVHPDELSDSLKKKLSDRGYFYANSNAGLGWTDRANRYEFGKVNAINIRVIHTSFQGGIL